jgi:hypothetical protein
VFLERDRMMQVDMDDEQVDGAGWRYGRRKGRRILSFTLPIVAEKAVGRYDAGWLPSVASSAAAHAGQYSLGHDYPTRLELYDPVDQVRISLATWVSLS